MSKFAHMADVHLGAHREPAMQKLELAAFDEALDRCKELGVDFILISGDLFHVGIPDLTVVNSALRKMMQIKRAGIQIYAIYGSHDYTPTGTSVIDILDTAGVIVNLSKWKLEGGKLRLAVHQDERTGTKLAGISARKIGLESKYYEILDRKTLEDEEGFKVFAFHSGITEFKPEHLREMETLDISSFPKGFDYYAGGHIHQRGEFGVKGYEKVVFPGPLFTGYGRDVEDTARGEKRGFYLVEFDDRIRSVKFSQVEAFGGIYREYAVGGKNAAEVNAELVQDLASIDVKGKVVVIRIHGELAGGRAADIDFGTVKKQLDERGALYIYLNRYSLSSKETSKTFITGEDLSAIERSLFARGVSKIKVSQQELSGEKGAAVATELLRVFRQGSRSNELKKDYRQRMVKDGLQTLKLQGISTDAEK
ncbi:MAG: exonuclease SbcCD subunit D [Thaumarchaeota archaeon]|nr:exonuclease SbcCD subunit D [Nitrososphaerota archaeon]